MRLFMCNAKTNVAIIATAVLLAGSLSCGPAQQANGTSMPTQVNSAANKPRPTTHIAPQLPTAPLSLQRVEVPVLPPVTLTAVSQFVDKDALYVKLALPAEIQSSGLFNTREAPPSSANNSDATIQTGFQLTMCDWSRLDGRATLLTPQVAGGDSEDTAHLILRVEGTKALAAASAPTVTVRGCDLNQQTLKAGAQREIRIDLQSVNPAPETVRRDFQRRFANWFSAMRMYEDFSHFTTYAFHRLASLAAGRESYETTEFYLHGTPESDLSQMMDFYTGRSSVRQAMAMDNAIGLPPSGDKQTVALNSILGITHQNRDYLALLSAAGMPTPTLDPLSEYLPADTLNATFVSLPDLVGLIESLDRRLGDAARLMESLPGAFLLEKRYSAQLGISLRELAKAVDTTGVGATALVLGDSYLREGTDVTLVFRNRDTNLLSQALNAQTKAAADTHGGIQSNNITIDGISVAHLFSTDQVVNRYEARLDKVTLISNSKGGIARLVAVYQKKHPALAAAPDYQYARAVVPYSAQNESGFIFAGDGLMAQMCSAHDKIAESRRMRARERLQAVNYAALLFGWMKGRPPQSEAELLASPWLTRDDLRHADGSVIHWSPNGGARSDWGTASQIKPVVDIDITSVSEAERDAYTAFRDGYDMGWRGQLDPALLQLRRAPHGDDLDAQIHILPLSPTGKFFDAYQALRELSGEAHAVPAKGPNAIRATFALGQDSQVRQLGRNYLSMLLGQQFVMELLGERAEIGFLESAEFQQFLRELQPMHLKMATDASADATDVEGRLTTTVLPQSTLYAAIEIGNPLVFAGALVLARTAVMKSATGLVTWEPAAPCGDIPVTRISVVKDAWSAHPPVDLYYAIANGIFHVAFRREVLDAQLDATLSAPAAKPVQGNATARNNAPEDGAQFSTFIAPAQEGWMVELATEMLVAKQYPQHQQALFARTILERGLGNSLHTQAALEDAAITNLGYYPQSPFGGEFSVDTDGLISHPHFGSWLAPSRPSSLRTLPIGMAIRAVLSALFTVSTYNRGNEVELVSTAKIRFKK